MARQQRDIWLVEAVMKAEEAVVVVAVEAEMEIDVR